MTQVWNLQPTFKKLDEGSNSFDEVPTWYIRRKYDEFYVLDARLKEFHGGAIGAEASRNQFNVSLPAKQRRISIALQSNAKTLEYLNSIKLDFTKYLQVVYLEIYSEIGNSLKSEELRYNYCFQMFKYPFTITLISSV